MISSIMASTIHEEEKNSVEANEKEVKQEINDSQGANESQTANQNPSLESVNKAEINVCATDELEVKNEPDKQTESIIQVESTSENKKKKLDNVEVEAKNNFEEVKNDDKVSGKIINESGDSETNDNLVTKEADENVVRGEVNGLDKGHNDTSGEDDGEGGGEGDSHEEDDGEEFHEAEGDIGENIGEDVDHDINDDVIHEMNGKKSVEDVENEGGNESGELDDREEEDDEGEDGEEERDEREVAEEDDLEGDEQVSEAKVEKQLDHDQDRRNPQYIPKGGAFYEHDNRTSMEDVKSKDSQEGDKKKKVWRESKESEKWLHDWYKESEQQPKTKAEIMETYGYDIRNEEAPPRARRRRKYGRGPDKYDRNWEDEQAYMVKQNAGNRRGKKKSFGKDEFPPLPNQKGDSNADKTPPRSAGWKREEESNNKRTSRTMNHSEKSNGPSQGNRSEYSSNRNSNNYSGGYGGGDDGGSGRGNNKTEVSNKKSAPTAKKIVKEEIKSFRQYDKSKWKSNNFKRGKPEDGFKTNKSKQVNQGESQTPRSLESSKSYSGDSDVGHVTEGFSQMTFHSKHSNIRENRQESNEISEQELDSPANRLNPKRYSKNRKGFTGFFPPEEIVEIDPVEMKQLQQEQQQKSQHVSIQQQPLNIQSVIRRYPGTYNGNPGYIAPRPIITGIPQQGMSPQGLQQALSPQGIPQQALSPQVPGLQTIELQQGPIPPQANFVPPIYIDMDPHYGPSEMMGPYTGYAPYSANQPSEMYQPSSGITYYNTECQNSNQIRPLPPRRQKTAIPILPPPK